MAVTETFQEYAEQAVKNYHLLSSEQRLMLVNVLKDKKIKRVLDVGCGGGQEMLPFAEETEAFCVGIDFALEVGTVGGKTFEDAGFTERYAFAVSKGEILPFAGESFDVVICRVALPYMHNRQALAEISRVLKPGGIFFLKTHSPLFYFGMMRRRLKNFNIKQMAYPVICLVGGIWNWVWKQPPEGAFWKGKEVFQTEGFLRRELAKNNLQITDLLPDTNPETPSFLIVKKRNLKIIDA